MALITITQQFQSHGDEVGKRLAEQLSCPLIDRAQIERVAARYSSEVTQTSPPELGERAPSLVERLTQERRRFSVLLHAAVFELARQGDGVFVGYGVGFMLKDVRHVVRTRIVAPLEVRVRRYLAEHPELAKEAATSQVREADRRRSAFTRYMFHADWDDSLNYDMVLNTATMSPETGAEMLARLSATRDYQPTPASIQRLADLALGYFIEARLVTDPHVATPNVRAHVERGVVSLTGTVWSDEEKDIVESVAAAVPGVTEVRNDVHLQPPPPFFY